jgi:tartrate-resistant acid phosphatase type 5
MKQTRREFVRTLFIASQAAVAGSLLPGRLLAETLQPPATDALNFFVFGDWGRRGERDQAEVATQMAKAAKVFNPKFVVSVGDNFYENGVKSVHDPHWQESFEEVYSATALQVPWQCILGNHDYHTGGNCEAEIEYHKINPRWNMPARYYQQTYRVNARTTADFFYLDTTPMLAPERNDEHAVANAATQDVPQQLEWFKNALAASSAQWKIVYGHHPIYSARNGYDQTPDLVEKILPLLHEHKVQVYFNGHDHDLQHLVAGKLNLFDSGAGSRHREKPVVYSPHSKFARCCSGFTTISLQADEMNVCMIDNHGTQVYTTTVARS